MRILLIGATGTIGKAIAAELGARHEVLLASHQQAPLRVDIADPASIRSLYAKVGSMPGPLCPRADRKSTRLNSSHVSISYAVFCLKKKNKKNNSTRKNYLYLQISASHLCALRPPPYGKSSPNYTTLTQYIPIEPLPSTPIPTSSDH